jgi:hypothetical protein
MRRLGNTKYQRVASEDDGQELSSNDSDIKKNSYGSFDEIPVVPDSEGFASSVLITSKPLPLGVPGEEKRFFFQRSKARYNPDAVATLPSVFDDPDTLEEYRPPDDYENVHRFDPNARWTWEEENKLIRKIDFRIMLFAAVAFMAMELDRSNINQALTDDLLGDLGLTTNGMCLILKNLTNLVRLQPRIQSFQICVSNLRTSFSVDCQTSRSRGLDTDSGMSTLV